jgi:hypothetical protein
MINIDSNDFALLVKNVTPGSRPIQGLGDRDVFFNDIEQLPGGPMPHDNKTYMKCRRAGQKTAPPKPVIQAPLGAEAAKATTTTLGSVQKWASSQVATNGIISIVDVVLSVLAFAMAVYVSWLYASDMSFLLGLSVVAQWVARTLRRLVGFQDL